MARGTERLGSQRQPQRRQVECQRRPARQRQPEECREPSLAPQLLPFSSAQDGGVFFSRYAFHPTSILLAATSGADICAYCLSVSMPLSQLMSKKNFTKSSRTTAFSTTSTFCGP